MDSKKYICVDAQNISLLRYDYIEDLSPRPFAIPHIVGNARKIFEKNGVPEEFQKIFMETNRVSMTYQKMNSNDRNLYAFKYHRFKAKEYLTGLSVFLAFSKKGEIYGQQDSNQCTFCVGKCYECNSEDLINFMSQLKHQKLLANYIKSITETAQLRTSFSSEFYEFQIEYYKNKIFKK